MKLYCFVTNSPYSGGWALVAAESKKEACSILYDEITNGATGIYDDKTCTLLRRLDYKGKKGRLIFESSWEG